MILLFQIFFCVLSAFVILCGMIICFLYFYESFTGNPKEPPKNTRHKHRPESRSYRRQDSDPGPGPVGFFGGSDGGGGWN